MKENSDLHLGYRELSNVVTQMDKYNITDLLQNALSGSNALLAYALTLKWFVSGVLGKSHKLEKKGNCVCSRR